MKWLFTLLLAMVAAWTAHDHARWPNLAQSIFEAPFPSDLAQQDVEVVATRLPSISELLSMPARERLRLLILALPEMSHGEVASLYEGLVQFEGEPQVGIAAAVDLVLDRGLQLAPERALAFVRARYSKIRYWHRVPSLEEVMDRLAAKNLTFVLELPYEQHRVSKSKLTLGHFRELAARDPQAAIRQLGKVGDENASSAHSGIVDGWITHDPEAAIAWAKKIPEAGMRQEVLATLLNALTKQGDLTLAKVTAEDLEEIDLGKARTFIAAWAGESPLEAGAWLGPRLKDRRAFRNLPGEHLWSHGLSQDEGENAAFFLAALAGSNLGAEQPDSGLPLSKLFRQVARENAAEARAWLLKMPPGIVTPAAVEGLVEGWASSDPEGALAFADTLPEHYEAMRGSRRHFRANLQRLAIGQFAKQKPQAAAAYVDAASMVDSIGPTVAEQWAKQDHDAALEWILSKDLETSQALLTASLGPILQKDLQTGLDLMATLTEEQQERHRNLAMNVWIEEDPAAAAEWMSAFENQDRYQEAFGQLTRAWSKADIDAASRYVSEMAGGSNRDYASSVLARALQVAERFEDAYAWLGEISEPELRAGVAESLLTAWAHHDPAAVKAIRAQEEVKP